ncbi:MAG TPA: hypothetical protein VJM32_01210 [Candidatus Saccharimonadales bacterium]|nr:hypothetical protein [Candidatus Saccharimonadales bacterium]
MSYGSSRNDSSTTETRTPSNLLMLLLKLVGVWVLVPVLISLVVWGFWFLGSMAFTGSEWVADQEFWEVVIQRHLWPDGWNVFAGTGWGYILLLIWFVGTGIIAADHYDENQGSKKAKLVSGTLVVVAVISTLFSGVQVVRGINDNAKDEGRSYAGTEAVPATIFMVNDTTKIPSFIADLTKEAKTSTGNPCKLIGIHDVTGCVAQGDLPTNWERRIVSIKGATYQMQTNSPSAGNTDLRENTVSYLYRKGEDGKTVIRVSGVRDGKNNKPLHSVVEWDGRGNPTSCDFAGQYEVDKAFEGKWSKNLRDLIADQFPEFLYDDNDIWGWCDGVQPKVEIPGVTQAAFHQRTTLRPAGTLEITGDNGKIKLVLKGTVKAGELPGPTYPLTLVAKQREMSSWAAGERLHNRGGFGFEPTTASSQLGNASEFLLVNKDDNRVYWVSPLISRGSDSQQFVAYSITPADEVTAGRLNTQRIFVLNDRDPRIATILRMENRIKTYLSTDPGFYPAGGQVVEFLPLDGENWQAYGEVNGMVKYVFTVPLDESKSIRVHFAANGQEYIPPTPQATEGSPCADFTKATADQLKDCAIAALEEEKKRRGQATSVPTVAPSPTPGR